MSKIMVVDDDSNIRGLIHTLLKKDGFDVLEAADAYEAMSTLENEKTDLLILDVMMPGMDGLALCREIRSFCDLPILMLTAKGETCQKVRGLEAGADDYLAKPFDPAELIARIKALLRRCNIASSNVITIGKIVVDKNRCEILAESGNVTLPLKEFELLFTLACSPGQTFSRDRLIEDIWGYDFDGNERTLDVHIGRIREKFPQKLSGFKITTIRGLGYRLEVTE